MIPHYVYFIFPVFLFCVYILSNFSYLSSRFSFKLRHCFIQLIHFPFKFQQLYFKFQCISYYIIILITKRCYNIKSYLDLLHFRHILSVLYVIIHLCSPQSWKKFPLIISFHRLGNRYTKLNVISKNAGSDHAFNIVKRWIFQGEYSKQCRGYGNWPPHSQNPGITFDFPELNY